MIDHVVVADHHQPVGRPAAVRIFFRLDRLRPKLEHSTVSTWHDRTLPGGFDLVGIGTDEALAAMNWLLAQQDGIERRLAEAHLSGEANPSRMALIE